VSNLIPTSRLVQGSMSKTDLLLLCQYWASWMITLPKPSAVAPYPLRFGSAHHKTQEIHLESRGKKVPNLPAIAKKYDVELQRLESYYIRARDFIDDLIKKNWPRAKLYFVESKLAYDPFTDKTRFLSSTKERDYSQRLPNEFPGTGDLVVVPDNEDFFVTFDWKTGNSVYNAQYNGQLASVSLAISRHIKRYKAVVYIVRIDDEFIEPYPGSLDKELLEAHRKKLMTAISSARSASPSMRPGAHCHELYCPAISVCPAHAGPMALRDEMHGALEPERKALLFERFKAAEKMLQWMNEWFKEEIRRNGPFQRENGKWAVLRPDHKEYLSKASIVRALGRVDGEELISQLRERGCIDESDGEKIDYVSDPSGRSG
jgi:hypothetical protein